MKRVMLALVFSLLLVSCTAQEPVKIAAYGDTVRVNYIGTFEDGTLFDTNVQSVAEANGVSKPAYEPLEVTLGRKQVIPGFEAAILGMIKGSETKVTIPPEQAYGQIRKGQIIIIDRVAQVPRETTLQRTVTISQNSFDQLGVEKELGSEVQVGDISYEIVADDEEEGVTLRINVEEGDQIILPETFWNSTVIEVSEEEYVVRQDPADGSFIQTPFGLGEIEVSDDTITRTLVLEEGGSLVTQTGVGKVVRVNETKATIDFNHPLAGRTLVFEIELVEFVN